MPHNPSKDDIAGWQRWFAIEMNNLAWALVENPRRTPEQGEEMLHAAHAAALYWGRIGTELHKARAQMLLGEVHALVGSGRIAMIYAQRAYDYITSHESPDWEVALAHAILAHAAFAARETPLYVRHHTMARALGEAIASDDDKEIFYRTFTQLPTPEGSETSR